MEDTPDIPPPAYAPPPPPPVAPSPAVIPWEDPGRPWPQALLETIQLLVTSPRAAYERVPVRADVLRPVLFALAVGWVGMIMNAVWQLTFGDAMRSMMPQGAGAGYGQPPSIFYAAMIPLGPLFVAVGLLLSTLVLHVALLLVGGAKNGFVATLRALSYAQVASLGLILPFCGSLLAIVGSLVLQVIGISVLQRISTGKAVVAVLIPVVLCCGCFLAGIAMFGAAMFGMKDLMP